MTPLLLLWAVVVEAVRQNGLGREDDVYAPLPRVAARVLRDLMVGGSCSYRCLVWGLWW